MIALWNTALTSMGMIFLGLPGVPVLASLVFVTSFIPLIGVITSTIPMGLIALSESGPFKLVQVMSLRARRILPLPLPTGHIFFLQSRISSL